MEKQLVLMEMLDSDTEEESERSSSSSSNTETSSSSDKDIEELELYFQQEEELVFGLLFNKNKRLCIPDYFEEIVPSYNDEEFIRHFRIRRELFNDLSTKFEMSNEFKILRADKRSPANKQVAIFLWFAGHECCSFRDLANRFNMSLFAVGKALERIIQFLCSLGPNVIKWPNEEKKKATSDFFLREKDFPNVIGAIDGTHVKIDPPASRKDDYIDGKGVVSLCLQGICNEDRKFISVFVGYPGSCHDSWVFQNSFIYPKLKSLCGNYYLLGDSAYPCSEYLMTPYKDNGHLSRAQKKYNKKLSTCRVIIEHTFGILKQRFRQLYYCKLKGIPKLCDFIVACCVLHNLSDKNDLDFEETELPPQSEVEDEEILEETGKEIRDRICREIN